MNYNKVEPKDNMKVEKVDAEIVKERVRPAAITKSVKQKKGLITRLVHGTLGPDGFKKIRTNLKDEIIVPTLKRMLYEGITSTAGLLLYHDGTPPRAFGKVNEFVRGVKQDYAGISTSKISQPISGLRNIPYATDYVIADRGDVARVLDELSKNAAMYNSVSVADYYDMIGAPSTFADHNYGWSRDTLSHTTITPVRDGYVIKFPALELI